MAFSSGDERVPRGIADRADDLLHHQMAVPAREVLRPFDSFDVVVEVLGALRKYARSLSGRLMKNLLHSLRATR